MPHPPFSRYRPHPWHGLPIRPDSSGLVFAYIEITPSNTVKYEIDKPTGYLRVDRPQATNALPPMPYGFVPRTLCDRRIAELGGCERGDGDPLDICVLSERPIDQADVLAAVHIIGGLLMRDKGEADDKLIGVVHRDPVWGHARDIGDVPSALVERLRHYLMTYKLDPGGNPVEVSAVYGRAHAEAVLQASIEDYAAVYGDEARD